MRKRETISSPWPGFARCFICCFCGAPTPVAFQTGGHGACEPCEQRYRRKQLDVLECKCGRHDGEVAECGTVQDYYSWDEAEVED